MIEITGVQSNPRECRPLTRGWGLLHWTAYLPLLVLVGGLSWLTILLSRTDPVWAACILLGTYALFLTACLLHGQVGARTAQGAPAFSLPMTFTLDEDRVTISHPDITSSFAWTVIRSVREDKDRFVFLVSPVSNPVLPKRQMTPDQIEAVRALVARVKPG